MEYIENFYWSWYRAFYSPPLSFKWYFFCRIKEKFEDEIISIITRQHYINIYLYDIFFPYCSNNFVLSKTDLLYPVKTAGLCKNSGRFCIYVYILYITSIIFIYSTKKSGTALNMFLKHVKKGGYIYKYTTSSISSTILRRHIYSYSTQVLTPKGLYSSAVLFFTIEIFL